MELLEIATGRPLAPMTWPLVALEEALERPWPTGLGRDDRGPLVWASEDGMSLDQVFVLLAEVLHGLNHAQGVQRAWVSSPVTRRGGRNDTHRIPGTIRLRVARGAGGLRAWIHHVPARPSDEIWQALGTPSPRTFLAHWRAAHTWLDQHRKLSRVPAPVPEARA